LSAAKPQAWYLPVLAFVLAGPMAGGIVFLFETLAIQAAGGGGLPSPGEALLALRVLAAAYAFGIVPSALTGYFHFYSESWFRTNILRTLATCALGAALAAILPALHQRGPVIVVYAVAGAVAALVCIAVTAKLFPAPPAGLPPSRRA
jgi:hypothetical protein